MRKRTKEILPIPKGNCKFCGEYHEDFSYDSECDLCGASLRELYFDFLVSIKHKVGNTNYNLWSEFEKYKFNKEIEKVEDKIKWDKMMNEHTELIVEMKSNRRWMV